MKISKTDSTNFGLKVRVDGVPESVQERLANSLRNLGSDKFIASASINPEKAKVVLGYEGNKGISNLGDVEIIRKNPDDDFSKIISNIQDTITSFVNYHKNEGKLR